MTMPHRQFLLAEVRSARFIIYSTDKEVFNVQRKMVGAKANQSVLFFWLGTTVSGACYFLALRL